LAQVRLDQLGGIYDREHQPQNRALDFCLLALLGAVAGGLSGLGHCFIRRPDMLCLADIADSGPCDDERSRVQNW